MFEVIHPGVFTTIQDLGRSGYQKYGLAVSGSADHYSHRIANIIVNNPESYSVLEVTLVGLKMKSQIDTVIAVTGGDLTPKINGREIPMWATVKVKMGDIIHFAGCRAGCRAYISVAGGFNVPRVLGSRSTDIIGEIGGLEGRALKKGDTVPIGDSSLNELISRRRFLSSELVPTYQNVCHVRVILGPQDGAFTKEAISTFLSSSYKATKDINRMGCRLEGPKIEHRGGADIISEGLFFGAVQVPKNGQPIVFLVGRQSIGGYTKIGGVITVDLPKLAQVKPGDCITFQAVSIEEAHALLKERESMFFALRMCSHY